MFDFSNFKFVFTDGKDWRHYPTWHLILALNRIVSSAHQLQKKFWTTDRPYLGNCKKQIGDKEVAKSIFACEKEQCHPASGETPPRPTCIGHADDGRAVPCTRRAGEAPSACIDVAVALGTEAEAWAPGALQWPRQGGELLSDHAVLLLHRRPEQVAASGEKRPMPTPLDDRATVLYQEHTGEEALEAQLARMRAEEEKSE